MRFFYHVRSGARLPLEMGDRPNTDAPTRAPEINEDGVDLVQIRAMLDRTPAERLSFVTKFMNSLIAIRALNETRGPR